MLSVEVCGDASMIATMAGVQAERLRRICGADKAHRISAVKNRESTSRYASLLFRILRLRVLISRSRRDARINIVPITKARGSWASRRDAGPVGWWFRNNGES